MKKVIVLIVIIVSCLSPGVAKADLAGGLVAFYPFNGNANDESKRKTCLIDKWGQSYAKPFWHSQQRVLF